MIAKLSYKVGFVMDVALGTNGLSPVMLFEHKIFVHSWKIGHFECLEPIKIRQIRCKSPTEKDESIFYSSNSPENFEFLNKIVGLSSF